MWHSIRDHYRDEYWNSLSSQRIIQCIIDLISEISDDDIEWYVSHEENLLKKAGYSLEGIMSLFLERLDGDYYNVLGLPLGELYKGINELGYSLKDLD